MRGDLRLNQEGVVQEQLKTKDLDNKPQEILWGNKRKSSRVFGIFKLLNVNHLFLCLSNKSVKCHKYFLIKKYMK